MIKRNSVMKSSLTKFAEEAYGSRMLGEKEPDLSSIYYASLNDVLNEDLPIID